MLPSAHAELMAAAPPLLMQLSGGVRFGTFEYVLRLELRKWALPHRRLARALISLCSCTTASLMVLAYLKSYEQHRQEDQVGPPPHHHRQPVRTYIGSSQSPCH